MQIDLQQKNNWLRWLLLLTVINSCYGCSQIAPRVIEAQIDIRDRANSVAVRDVMLPVADNTVLRTLVFVPELEGRVPTILVRAPLPDDYKSYLMVQGVGRLWSMRGYAVVIQGTRGYFGSGGSRSPFLTERADGLATLEWLRAQPFYNREVYTWGGSYFGYTQWQISDQPDIAGMFVHIASRRWFPVLYPSGVLGLESVFYWGLREGMEVPSRETIERLGRSEPLVSALQSIEQPTEILESLLRNDSYNDFWRQAEATPQLASLTAPVFLLGGWYDPFLEQQLVDFEQIRREARGRSPERSRMMIGPWTHAGDLPLPASAPDSRFRRTTIERALPWFDSLRPNATPGNEPTRYEVFVLGKNVWRSYLEWPPENVTVDTYRLASAGRANSSSGDGLLVTASVETDCSSDSFDYNKGEPAPSFGGSSLAADPGTAEQSSLSGRNDVLVYTADPTADGFEIVGQISLALSVSHSGPSADFVATVVEVFPDGSSYNIVQGITRVTSDRAERREARITFPPIHRAILPGHRLRLLVAGSGYPMFALNPFSEKRVRQHVYHGACTQAALAVPVLPLS